MAKKIIFFIFLFLFILVGIFFVSSRARMQTNSAITATVKISICGNQVAEYGEQCDNSDLKGKSCKTLGYDGGTLTCLADCSFDTSDCEESDNNDQKDSNDKHKTSSASSNTQNAAEQQPALVVGKIEKDNETRTLEVVDNYSGDSESPAVSESEVVKIVVADSKGNSAEVEIAVSNNQFVIRQGNVTVSSQFSIIADKDAGKIFILGPAGKTELKILPGEIFEAIKNSGNGYEIEKVEIDADGGEIVYAASARKEEKLLGLFRIKIPLKLKYSAQDGNLVKTEESLLWKLVDFFSF